MEKANRRKVNHRAMVNRKDMGLIQHTVWSSKLLLSSLPFVNEIIKNVNKSKKEKEGTYFWILHTCKMRFLDTVEN